MDKGPINTDSMLEHNKHLGATEPEARQKQPETTIKDPQNESGFTPPYGDHIDQEKNIHTMYEYKIKFLRVILAIGKMLLTFSMLMVICGIATKSLSGVFYVVLAIFPFGVGTLLIVPALIGLAKDSGHYPSNNTDGPNPQGFAIGIMISLVSVLILISGTPVIVSLLPYSNTPRRLIGFDLFLYGPLFVAGLIGLFEGINITVNNTQTHNRKRTKAVLLICVLVALTILGLFIFVSR